MAETGAREIPAADLLAEGSCSAMCLLAQEPTTAAVPCTCRCRGKHHGALADATIPGPEITRWWVESGMAGWKGLYEVPGGYLPTNYDFDGLGVMIPVARNEGHDRRLYREFTDEKRDVFYVRNTSGPGTGWTPKARWEVLWDAYTIGDRKPWGDRESRLMNRLVKNLLLRRRITQAPTFPAAHGALTGFKNLEEACVTYLVMGECFVGNVSSVVRAIEVLDGRPDPVALGYHPEWGFPEELAAEEDGT